MRKRLEALKNDQKGFTLVELIVVLVILAIMAALLVPALLGYVDKAKEGRYLEEARSIYTAVQALNDEKYAKDTKSVGYTVDELKAAAAAGSKSLIDKINDLVAPTTVKNFVSVGYINNKAGDKKAYSVNAMEVKFASQDSSGATENIITAKMADGTWTIDLGSGS